MTVPSLRLHDGTEIPQVGFSLFQAPADETRNAVELALDVGYRHIDTAAAYGNEKEVGAALAASGLPREDYFVASKLWISRPDHESTVAAFEESLNRLGLDHVDLCLIHWPIATDGWFAETWRALEQIHAEEATRTIGVSSFRIADLKLLERKAETRPTINQIELHPYFQQTELRAWHARHGLATEAWSPVVQNQVLDDATIVRLAERHGKTPAQIVLRWHLQLGDLVIPKPATPKQIRENIDLFDFKLSDREMAAIGNLDRDSQIGSGPATFATH